MAKNMVIYNSHMNLLPMPMIKASEMDIFMALLATVRDKKLDPLSKFFNPELRQIRIPKHKLAQLAGLTKRRLTRQETYNSLNQCLHNLLKNIISYENPRKGLYYNFVCFEKTALYEDREDVEITLQKDFYEMLINHKFGFTVLELGEFTGLSSKYSKVIYRLLKQFRTTGQLFMDFEEFRRILKIPDNYKMAKIDEVILGPALMELGQIFKGLIIEKKKDKSQRGRGGKVVGISFRFKPEPAEIASLKQNSKQDISEPKTEAASHSLAEPEETPQAPPDGKGPSQNDEWQLQKARELMAKMEEVSQQRKKKLYEGISKLTHKCTAEQGKMGVKGPYTRIKDEDENEDKINPITQERIGIFDEYLYFNILIWDEKMQRNNSLKIVDDLQLRALNFSTKIKNDEEGFKLNFINRDDGFMTTFTFNNFSHFKAWFEAYKF